MRVGHLERLQPRCLACGGSVELRSVHREVDGHVVEGTLVCTAMGCQREHPVLDGLPILVGDLRGYVAGAAQQVTARDDLGPDAETLIGDCVGPGSAFDTTRQHLSSYAWDHYGDLDPDPPVAAPAATVLSVLDAGLELAGTLPDGPVLDLGCAVGRTSFALAERTGREVLGTDLSYAMARLAGQVLREQVVRYPLRRVGLVYDRREFPVELAGADRVDFWVADAAALPFEAGTFAAVVAVNVLDCVASPLDFLGEVARVLVPGGRAVLTSPYDWSPSATPVEAWIGGHSQRGGRGGSSELLVRDLLTPGAHPSAVPGLELVAEEASVPWRVRLHDRSTVDYTVDVLVAEAGSPPPAGEASAGAGR